MRIKKQNSDLTLSGHKAQMHPATLPMTTYRAGHIEAQGTPANKTKNKKHPNVTAALRISKPK